MTKLFKLISYLKRVSPYLFYFIPAYIISLFEVKKLSKEEIWLICERGDEARDNGYHLYKYIKENQPEINSYYVITKDSPDYNKVSQYGEIIEYNSFKHFVYFILSNKLISTHIYGAMPYGKAGKFFLWAIPKKSHIFLQHGVIKDKLKIDDDLNDIIICSSEIEKELLSANSLKVINSIKVVGLCRYDNLIDESNDLDEKVILIMPTFRVWLEDTSRIKFYESFVKNDPYYVNWNKLLSDSELINYIEQNNIKVIFYPHYRSQKFLHLFEKHSKNIILASNKDYDIQDLLKKSKVLITDFSSVFFDFVYMHKPVIYFQFDTQKYRELQYKEGTFSYMDDGFGPVFSDIKNVVNYLISSDMNAYQLEQIYKDRIVKFFKYSDSQNTLRNFETINAVKRVKHENII